MIEDCGEAVDVSMAVVLAEAVLVGPPLAADVAVVGVRPVDPAVALQAVLTVNSVASSTSGRAAGRNRLRMGVSVPGRQVCRCHHAERGPIDHRQSRASGGRGLASAHLHVSDGSPVRARPAQPERRASAPTRVCLASCSRPSSPLRALLWGSECGLAARRPDKDAGRPRPIGRGRRSAARRSDKTADEDPGEMTMQPGGIDLQNIVLRAQKMQAEMERAQAALAKATVSGSAGGGLVTAVVDGSGELQSLTIDPSVVDPQDVDTLADLVVAAVRDAVRSAAEMTKKAMGSVAGGLMSGMGLPGLGGMAGLAGLPGAAGLAIDADGDDFDGSDDDSGDSDDGPDGPGPVASQGDPAGPTEV